MTWKEEMKLAQSMIGCEVRPPDGGSFTVIDIGIRYNRPAVLGEGVFVLAAEATVIRTADGHIPAIQEADPIMRQVFAIIAARGEYSEWQVAQWLDTHDRDPDSLYHNYIARAIDQIEKLMDLDTADDEELPEQEPSGLLAGYIYRHDGNRVQAASELGQDLMRGNPAEHKAGYTLPNAVLAVKDAFSITEGVSELDDGEVERLEANLRGWEEAREEVEAEEIAGLRGEQP